MKIARTIRVVTMDGAIYVREWVIILWCCTLNEAPRCGKIHPRVVAPQTGVEEVLFYEAPAAACVLHACRSPFL